MEQFEGILAGMSKLLVLLLFLTFQNIFAQNEHLCGLGFNSCECVAEQRTTLDLTKNGKIALGDVFTISFEIAIRNSSHPGQIFNIIAKEFSAELYFINYVSRDSALLKLIVNQTEQALKIPIAKNEFNSAAWDRIAVQFNLPKQRVKILFNGKEYSSKINTHVKEIIANISFGSRFHSANAPAMNISEIKVFLKDVLLHYWKLNETEGTIAHDTENELNATVENPVWLLPRNYQWQFCAEIGPFQVQKIDIAEVTMVFNDKANEICFIGKNFLYRYNVISKAISKDIFTLPRPHRQSSDIYNSITNKFLSQHAGQGKVSEYDASSKSWSGVDTTKEYDQHYYGHNLFVNPLNGDLMMMNGYGWYLNKNTLQKYDFKDNKWKLVVLKGDYINPRSGAALINLNNTGKFLLFGGEGNESGKQEDGYRFLYDLNLIDLTNLTTKRIWELKNFSENLMTAAGSFYDEKNNCFFVLLMDYSNIVSPSMLYKFDIDKPTYETVSNQVGRGIALFFSKTTNKFYMVTHSRTAQKKNYYELYELNYPPITSAKYAQLAYKTEEHFLSSKAKPLLISGSIIIAIGLIWLYKRRNNNIQTPNTVEVSNTVATPQLTKNSIFLFGDFQVFDKDGKEITKEFTPKLKQLFLLLFTRSYNGSVHGISTEALSTYLWPDLNLEQTKNNRNVSMTKLRAILARLDGVEVKNEKNFLELSLGENVYSDYNEIREILKSDEWIIDKIERVHAILSRGELLSGCSFEWFDTPKVNFTEAAIAKLKNLASKNNLDGKTKLALADSILHLDAVNEDGLIFKIKAYAALGDHQLAKTSYELFKKEYNRLYAEEYQKSFADLLN